MAGNLTSVPSGLHDRGIEQGNSDERRVNPSDSGTATEETKLDDQAVEPAELGDKAKGPSEVTTDSSLSSREALICLFPSELLLHIFGFLTPRELCCHVTAVCRQWRHLAYNQCLWTRLDVCHYGVTGDQLCRIMQCVPGAIRYLNITKLQGRFSDASFTALIKNCRQLVDLDISGVLNPSVAMIRSVLVQCPGLQSLSMVGGPCLDHRVMEEIAARAGPMLKRLRLDCCRLTDSSLELMMRRVQGLTHLSLDHVTFSEAVIKRMIVHYSGTLEDLQLDGRNLTDWTIGALTTCRLHSLSISCCHDLTQQALRDLALQDNLHSLALRKGVSWNARALKDFFSSSNFSGIRHLDVTHCCQMDNRGLQAVVQTCGACLQTLCLSWCVCITDQGLEHVASKCMRLERLELTGLHRLQGSWLPAAVDTIRTLIYISFQLCQNVRVRVMEDAVVRRPQITILNYFGDTVRLPTGS